MDPNPNMDLPPMTTDHLTDPSPPVTTNHSHPPYPEMIIGAISGLKDKDGSSRQAISKYIEKEFTNLQPTHVTLLTHHLKRMKNEGQLIMFKHSYMLPPNRSTAFTLDFTAGNVPNQIPNLDNSTSGLSKKKPGRPPKLKPVVPGLLGVQNQMPNVQVYDANVNANAGVQSYQPQFQYNVGGGGGGPDLQVNYGSGLDFQGNAAGGSSEPLFASLGLGDDGVALPSPPLVENKAAEVKRGRGRPPKSGGRGGKVQRKEAGGEIQGVEKRVGRPERKPKSITAMMAGNGLRVKKGRGRPKRIGDGPVTVPLYGSVLRPRERPKRLARPNVSVNGVAGEMGLGKRRPGRPPVNKFANLTGKPMGRPSKDGPGTAVLVTDPRQLVVYQELKNKYELLQSKVKQMATVVKACIDPAYGNAALGALQELEALAGEANAPSHGQT